MPALGADMESGRLLEWRVSAGSLVRPGDVVAVVETQKGAIDVEIFLEGTIEDLVPVGTELPVGGLLARVRGMHEPATAASPQAAAAAVAAPAPAPARVAAGHEGTRAAAIPAAQAFMSAPQASTRIKASPGARRRAHALGIDLAALRGSGPDGSIVLQDVEAGAPTGEAPREPAAAPARRFDPAQMRAAIAAAMGRSKREIPHYYLTLAVDFAAADRWLAAFNAERPPAERLLPAALLLKASALALRAVPQLNGFWRDGAAQPAPAVHVGWAISLRGGGLVAPAVHDADRKALPELMAALRDLVQRARSGGLRSSELADPTVTVTSLGERGADGVQGVIYPPQLALIGFGRIAPRPWVADGQVLARPVVHVSLAADHRASDGHLGGQLLAAIDAALQKPEGL
ncbi:dihydrolipoamide acetyltransferase family protein [Ramlibacter tataouinensis]|uniref:dihydrolipoamide acetyltransferase family protein n=1 Tax=Ramlibacter tataouinensis TaxID=94132 RepID=UPI0022F3C1BB|nr:dihydrolipoamide acetyltransferase family protein [Ramlibacter tataouinensis]WBY02300.1 dihydrolipoamide acetyltransferase family protein [Ramlibacter tataouinensis]